MVLLLAVLALTACGGSSKKASSSTTASTQAGTKGVPTSTSTTPGSVLNAGRYGKLQACLKAQGITLPARKARKAGAPPTGSLGLEGEPALPKGVGRARFDEALKKCGARSFGGTGLGNGRLNSPSFRKALASFATCLSEHGISLPKPNLSGNGPVFSTKGIKTSSPQFLTAQRACAGILQKAFARVKGGRPPGTNPGAPGPLGAVPTPQG